MREENVNEDEVLEEKVGYFAKFLISFFIFWSLYYVMYAMMTSPSPGNGIALLFFIPFWIFIHIPILIYSLYCFGMALGKKAGWIFAIFIIALIISPSFIAEAHFNYLCEKGKNDNFPKITYKDFDYLLSEKSREDIREKIKIKFGVLPSFVDYLKDGRLWFSKYEKPLYCSYANC